MKKQKTYKKPNKSLFHRESPRQDFIFPRVLSESKRHPKCWGMKYGSRKKHTGQKVFYEGETWVASRLSYHLNVKNIPTTNQYNPRGIGNVLHTCGNAWCLNPRHLFLLEPGPPEKVEREKRQKELEKQNAPKTNKRLYSGRRKKTKTRTGPKAGHKNLGASFWLFMRSYIYWGA